MESFADVCFLGIAGEEISFANFAHRCGLLRDNDSIPVLHTLMLVEPLARLLETGDLRELAFLARWEDSLSMFGDWPCKRWVANTIGQHYVPESIKMTAHHFERMASDMRVWVNRFGMVDDPDSGPSEFQQVAEKHVKVLDSMVAELGGVRQTSWEMTKNRRHS